MFAAVTAWSWKFVRTRPRQRIMSPFTSDGVGAFYDAPMYRHTTTNTGPENDAERCCRVARGAIGRFGQRKAIGVICDFNFASEQSLEILSERAAVETDRIRIADAM